MFFDLGETLFKPLPEQVSVDNLLQVAKSASVDAPSEQIVELFKSTKEEVSEELRGESFYYHRDFVREACRRTFRALLNTDANELAHTYFEIQSISVINLLEPRSDCLSVLQALRNDGSVTAIVSNIDNDWLFPLVDKWQLGRKTDLILSSETAKSCKPHSKIFLDACSYLDCEPSDVLFVGDSEENDVGGAKILGMKTARLNIEGKSQTQADLHIKSLSDLLDAPT